MIADDKLNRVVVPPMKISEVPFATGKERDYRSYKLQFQAPQGVGVYTWKLYVVSDTFVGEGIEHNITVRFPLFTNVHSTHGYRSYSCKWTILRHSMTMSAERRMTSRTQKKTALRGRWPLYVVAQLSALAGTTMRRATRRAGLTMMRRASLIAAAVTMTERLAHGLVYSSSALVIVLCHQVKRCKGNLTWHTCPFH